jgi:hypothetical protein
VSSADQYGRTGLWNAGNCGHCSTLKALIEAGCAVNISSSDRNPNSHHAGASAVYAAAFNGHCDCVKELVTANADIMHCNS